MKVFQKILKKYEREILSILAILVFIIPYLLINSFSSGRKTQQIGLFIDQTIPFLPSFILIYLTGFILTLFPYFLIKNKTYFRRVILAYLISFGFSYLIFLVYPVQLPRFVTGSGIFYNLTQWVYSVDGPHNNFPSLHVVMSFLSAWVCYNYNKKYGWLFGWAALISISTLFVKQHYFLDVIAGLVVSFVVYKLVFKK